MERLQREAIDEALRTFQSKTALIDKIMKLGKAAGCKVVVITPVQYTADTLIVMLYQTLQAAWRDNARRKKIYLCFSNLGTSFFTNDQAMQLGMAKKVFESLGGVYVENLETLHDTLLNQLGETNA
jgi:hypothetical protein